VRNTRTGVDKTFLTLLSFVVCLLIYVSSVVENFLDFIIGFYLKSGLRQLIKANII
jgi:hypothetical protein